MAASGVCSPSIRTKLPVLATIPRPPPPRALRRFAPGDGGRAMRLAVERVISSGNAVLDRRVTDIEIHSGPGGVMVYVGSGRNGGIVGYRLDGAGNATVQTTLVFPPQIAGVVSDRIVIDPNGGAPRLYVGADASGLIAYGIGANLAIGGRLGMGWTPTLELARDGGLPVLEAVITQTPRADDLLPPGLAADRIVDLQTVTIGTQQVVVMACAASDTVRTLIRNPSNGDLAPADQVGPQDGLGIRAPTAMETVVVGGTTYAVLVSAGTSSITVLRVGADGRLDPVEHLIDTGSTRFEGVQAVAVVQAGGQTFVIVGGADHGVTLFLMLPDGRLVWLDTLADTAALSLANVSAIAAVVQGGEIHIFVGSSRDTGVTHLTIPIDTLGVTREGTPGQVRNLTGTTGQDVLIARTDGDTLSGGAGTDILVSGPGRTVLRGDGGGDVFVIRATSTRVEIVDFQVGSDRLDLSDLPMLRDVDQLRVTPTANGARIEYRGVTITVTSADGRSLTVDDLFPQGLLGPDRIPVLQRTLAPEPARMVNGTEGNDTLTGGTGNDTIQGLGGNDTITLRGGNNTVWAGAGNDTITAGPGNDTIGGGPGDDMIYATAGGNNFIGGFAGNDTIYGGPGNDTLFGSEGDDLIYSGGGQNRVFGGEGNDLIYGGNGGNGLGGGAGNDTIWGGTGNDSLWGVGGQDLMYGMDGNDELWGADGHDTLYGGNGNDVLGGGNGNDYVYGDAGNDTLWGGPGDDRMWGGSGADTFIFYTNADINRIMDFDPGQGDRLQLFAGLWAGSGTLTAAQIVARFGSVNEWGSVVLDFSAVGGTTIILFGFGDLQALVAAIDII